MRRDPCSLLPYMAAKRSKTFREVSRSGRAGRLIHRVATSPPIALPPFQALLDEHAADVMAVLRGAVGRADAEDCFQETFLAALRGYPKLRDGSNLRGWLLTIAHRKAIDQHRANGRRPLPVAEPEPGVANVAGAGDELRDDGLWELVGGLPPKQRAAVALRYACDLPHAEIAAALGCSPEAARRSLHEGIKRLRKELS
jgi:RNA polymerase sigma factor (sigma-70 family)